MENPTKSILDPSFRYVPSHSPAVCKAFERVQREREFPERRQTNTVVQINSKEASP